MTSEPTSRCFVARLGALDPAVEERVERWAAASCVEHVLRRGAEGAATLYAVKGTEKTARQYQSLLRTLTSHWKMSLGKLERGWLALLSEREYRAAVKDAAGCAASCARSSAASCTTEAAEVQECTGGEGAPSRAVLTDGCRHPLSLSEGFDERAQALFASLRSVSAS
jgi:hypothetical protein